MPIGRARVDVDEQTRKDAVEWFVLNNAEHDFDVARVSQWERWCDEPHHVKEYLAVVSVQQDLRSMFPPRVPGRQALLLDLAREPPFGK